ncbi:GLPGLI family protein [Siphonobacter sp. SORGH_AS 1065]|nr:GLPGLI family protein [Siphonobacter sp. SORGH_AS_1065]
MKNQKIIAWFADDIPVSVGPERMYGLPGIILELDYNDGVSVITATKVEMKKVDPKELVLPKMKGKKINMADHDRIIKEHIKDSIGARRNPYWGVNLWN